MCGFSVAYVRNINKGISQRYLKKISDTFPELNLLWLQTGEGQMLNEVIPINVQNNSVGNNSSQTIVAGNDNNVTISEKDRQLLDSIQKMCDENATLKTENAELKIKVEMLQEQVDWLRTLVKQQQS
jgi:predicted RNase H-like nuclease (RuvC/YqgF family)